MARLRRALVQAQVRVKQYEAEAVRTAEPSTASASAPPAGTAPAADARVEHAPQRLDNDTVARMVTEFKEAYPGELLDSNAMPSIRLLSLVHAWFKEAATPRIKYVPWQYRMSQRQYTEIVEARAHRVIRTEAQLLSTALFDDTPTIGLESHIINASWLGARQRIVSNAIALCKGAHLAVLKAFDAKVLELCTQTWQPGHGLRNVTARDSRENLTSWHRRNNHASSTCRHLQIGRWALETGSCCPSSTTPGCTRAAWASPRVVEPWIPGRPDAYWALRRWGHDAQTAPSGKITSQASDFPHPSGHPRLSLLGLQTVWPL